MDAEYYPRELTEEELATLTIGEQKRVYRERTEKGFERMVAIFMAKHAEGEGE
jgi:hypothetical protein